MTDRLVFMDPPNPDTRNGLKSQWDAVADQVREHPGRWVMVGVYGRAKAAAGRTRLKLLGCEATIRRVEDTTRCQLYTRWPENVA